MIEHALSQHGQPPSALPGRRPAYALSLARALGLTFGFAIAACSQGGSTGPHPGTDDPEDGGLPMDLASPDPRDSGTGSSDGGDGGVRANDLGVDASPPGNDPFDPGSCSGPALSSAQALTLLGGAARAKLADATLYRRSRTCTGMTMATCGAWGTPVVHQQDLLTYSGGVVTDYKTFSFPTHLILFATAGQPKFVIRHESDYLHDATADSRGVGFSVGADPMENTYPVIYVWDFAPAPDRYEDLQGKLGDKGDLHTADHCARVVFTSGLTTEIAALYKY